MGRLIKFRAWDKVKNKMGHAEQINFGSIIDPVSHVFINFGNKFDWYPYSDVELMQYTGLKDKNGVEIYEGDILREDCQDFPFGDYKQVWEVEDLPEFYGHRFDPCVGFGCNNVEVIGNIYEHPHLLEHKL